MKTLNTQELFTRMQAGPVALFDVRGDVIYEQGHIPGAMTAPLGSLNFRIRDVMNPGSFVAVYCEGNGCTLASQAVDRLENLGLTNVHAYEEGISGWQAAGHETVESPFAKVQARGPVVECRSPVVNTETAYGGVFKHTSDAVDGAGG
jgi:rhodanese-related sulfurtransferase